MEKKKKADEASAAALKKAQDEEAERKRLKKIEDDKRDKAIANFKLIATKLVSEHN